MDGPAADAKRVYCNTEGLFGAPCTCKINLAFPLYTRRHTLTQSCIFEHQQYQMKSFTLPSSAPHLQARPTLLPPSSSALQNLHQAFAVSAHWSRFQVGTQGDWEDPVHLRAAVHTRQIAALACIAQSQVQRVLASVPPQHRTMAGKKEFKLTSTALTLMTSNALPSPIHS